MARGAAAATRWTGSGDGRQRYNSGNQKVLANGATDRDTNDLAMQTQVPTQTREGPTFTQLLLGEEDFDLPPYVPDEAEENNQFYHQTMNEFLNMNQLGNNGTRTTQLEPQEQMMMFGSSSGIGSQLSGSQAIEVVDVVGGLTSPWGTQLHEGHLAHLMSYIRAFRDLEQQTSPNLVMQQSIGPTYGHINTLNNRNSEFHFLLEQAKNPENNVMRLINIRSHVPAFSADPFGSRFIQHKLERATPTELLMVYKEIVPHTFMLAIDVFANYVIQKLLGYGPTLCGRELIGKLIGHVVALSLHMYGCRVTRSTCVYDMWVQWQKVKCGKWLNISGYFKAFEVSDMDQRIEMANERVLEWCDDLEILKELISEIVEGVLELVVDQFGNYVVQYVVEHGGESVRAMIVMRLKGLMVMLSCQKYGSNVMEKCLTIGRIHDRLIIAADIVGASEDQILMVMVNEHGNYVIQKMLETAAAEWVVDLIVIVVNRNFFRLIHYVHGRHVLAHLQILLAAREHNHRIENKINSIIRSRTKSISMNIFKEEATVATAINIIERAIPMLPAVDPAALLGVAEDRTTPMRAAADPAAPERRRGGDNRTSCQQGRGKSHRLPSKCKRRLHPRVVWERWKEEEEEEEARAVVEA
uniref:Pumilio domain-containing protein PPD1-like n=1 Tax=Oryza sativa subsp. japonica TaxID=39947 RepID=Q67UB7_ORYSJ|nr:pumilio domain-containing protein PPD1-like [Oryza sativa Japonica Group]